MVGAYARVTQDELDRALGDPDWASGYLGDLEESDYPGEEPEGSRRTFDVDKAWNGIGFLLNAAGGGPVDVVTGGAPLSADDLGYGPARFLTPAQVGEGARHLGAMRWEQLAGHFDPARMSAEDIYPEIWGDGHALDYLRSNYEGLVRFFSAAAAAGDAVILWLG
jgi:Domain of unknown function (DUF1877)